MNHYEALGRYTETKKRASVLSYELITHADLIKNHAEGLCMRMDMLRVPTMAFPTSANPEIKLGQIEASLKRAREVLGELEAICEEANRYAELCGQSKIGFKE